MPKQNRKEQGKKHEENKCHTENKQKMKMDVEKLVTGELSISAVQL